MTVDPARFPQAVRAASSILDAAQDHVYDADIFVRYTRRIIEEMGGRVRGSTSARPRSTTSGPPASTSFSTTMSHRCCEELARRGLKIGLISNSHRCLASFQEHFELQGLITAAVSSSEHGYMKPHPSIFEAALTLAGVEARDSVMVGDSLAHDIDGARRVGMRGVLVHRSDDPVPAAGVPVIRSMSELPALIQLAHQRCERPPDFGAQNVNSFS